jgi:hypothetical protein
MAPKKTSVGKSGSLERLKFDADEGSDDSYEKAKKWAQAYYWSRGSLVVFSALTSASALASAPELLHPLQPICALLVTIITGFDVWLKPGAKYRALYLANDEYAHLRQRLEIVSPGDKEQLETLLEEYRQINVRLGTVVIPEG